MKTFTAFCLFVFLAAFTASAQVRPSGPVNELGTSGPCTFYANEANGFTVSVHGNVIFEQSKSAGTPFQGATIVNDNNKVVGGCTQGNLFLHGVLADGSIVGAEQPFSGNWTLLYHSSKALGVGTNQTFPVSQPFSAKLVQTDAFVVQGSRVVMVGEYQAGVNHTSTRIYDITTQGSPKLLVDFGPTGIRGDSMAESCATDQTFWFRINAGSTTSYYRVDQTGKTRMIDYFADTTDVALATTCTPNAGPFNTSDAVNFR